MIGQDESSSTSLAQKEKALAITALADAALDEIASVTGVSRSTVRRFRSVQLLPHLADLRSCARPTTGRRGR